MNTYRRAALFLGLAIATIGLLAAVYYFTIGRPALVGVDHHDFGFITIPDGERSGSAEHTFTLTNRTSEPLNIERVHTSCGCTVSRYEPEVVQPGQSLEVHVALTAEIGLSAQKVFINTRERGMRTLTVRGVGRREMPLRTTRESMLVQPSSGPAQVFSVFADIWPGDLPEGRTEPTLEIDGGDMLDVTLNYWREQRPANARRHTPATWAGQVAVQPTAAAIESGVESAIVTITMESQHTVEFPVNIASARDDAGEAPPEDAAGENDDDGSNDNEVFNPLLFPPGSDSESDRDDH